MADMEAEVEDIMCDQGILSLNLDINKKSSSTTLSGTRLQLAIALISQSILPTIANIYYGYLRNQQTVVNHVRHQFLPSLIAFVANSLSASLSSVQRSITYPTNDNRNSNNVIVAIRNTKDINILDDNTPEESVQIEILSEPDENIEADVIFIHGLHGGIDRTWKQGSWKDIGHKWRPPEIIQLDLDQNLNQTSERKRKLSLKRSRSDSSLMRTKAKNAKKSDASCASEGDWLDMECEVLDLVEDDCYSTCWPRDWIRKDCPSARVIALNYDTDVLWCPMWHKKRIRTGMIERSNEMIEKLRNIGVGNHPITWVGHSKGGLYIKQILLNAFENQKDVESSGFCIYQQTKAILFYSVPHRGSTLADVTVPLLRRSIELIEIQRNCQFVLDLHQKFLDLYKDNKDCPEIYSFIETSFTLMSFVYLKIVAYDSADPGIGNTFGVPLDHREICKPAGRECYTYMKLIEVIRKTIKAE